MKLHPFIERGRMSGGLTCVAALILARSIAHADILPSFHEGCSTWNATHIVVVDPSGRVLESWKGDLKPGAKVPILQFGFPKVRKGGIWNRDDDRPPLAVERIVLFLVKGRGPVEWTDASLFGEMYVSAVWIERGRTYAFQQISNPGSTVLVDIGYNREQWDPGNPARQQTDEQLLKQRVATAVREQEQYLSDVAEPRPMVRAAAMLKYVGTDPIIRNRGKPFKVLLGCGKASWPVCVGLLQSADYSLHGPALEVMLKVSRLEARPHVSGVLQQELDYWKRYSRDSAISHDDQVSGHVGRLFCVLRLMLRHPPDETQTSILRELRRLWTTAPKLKIFGVGVGSDGLPVGECPYVAAMNAALKK